MRYFDEIYFLIPVFSLGKTIIEVKISTFD
jgi:hypothetical protein